ncbi:MAG: arginine N-succinyltransferase, partial [Bacteriovoracaceae bacterium]
ASKKKENNYYIFVLVNLETNKVVGASMIHGQHGNESEPHFFLKVGREHKFSETINTGFIHGTLKLGLTAQGWTEIGGLILSPEYRGHVQKLGKQLSYLRFLYIALKPEEFTDRIHAELMPPFDSDGNSPLWEAIGRRFMNLDYNEADRLSRENKEFILSLYPSDTIYETLLPLEARNAIGKVGETTKPVRKMLEKIGFDYVGEVDPFDGGPHFRATKEKILPIKEAFELKVKLVEKLDQDEESRMGIIQLPSADSGFKALSLPIIKNDDMILIEKTVAKTFSLEEGEGLFGIYTDY